MPDHFTVPLPAKVMMDYIQQMWQEARERLGDARIAEKQTQELFLKQYHALEIMGPFSGAEGYRIAKSLQETLQRRRQAKWDVKTWESVVKFMDATQHKMLESARYCERQNVESERYLREGPINELHDEDAAD
jgi:hypothetical protein